MTNGPVRVRADAATGVTPPLGPPPIAEAIAAASELARAQGRDDLVDRLQGVAERVARSETIVCVVGEFKKGKSALVNALIGSSVCTVDDDLATVTVTIVRHAAEFRATARRREGGRLVVETIDESDIDRWVAERDGADRPDGLELVEVALPSAFLERGVALVDTPGVGGLNAAHAAATLAFLPTADALVFVADASAELSGPELAFLETARKTGLPILIAVTKVDIYPQWRRIVAIDEKHLQAMGITDKPFPLSSVLRAAGSVLSDQSLDQESGFPSFADALIKDAVARARDASRSVAVAQILDVLDQLREPLAAEWMALERPEAAEQLARELQDVGDRLASLGGADASWSVRLEDEFAALRTRTKFAFDSRMRNLQRDTQEQIERIDPARSWPDVSQQVQQDTAAAVSAGFLQVTDGAAAIQAQIAELLALETVGRDQESGDASFDTATLWRGGPAFKGGAKTGLAAGIGLLGGAQVGTVGVEMLGMLGALLGTAVAGPVFLGVAAVIGGKHVIDERRRLLGERRQQARSFLSDFLGEVQFEADGRLASLLGEAQRQVRAGFTERIRELRRTYADTTEALERATERADSEHSARRTSVQAELRHIEELRDRAVALEHEPI